MSLVCFGNYPAPYTNQAFGPIHRLVSKNLQSFKLNKHFQMKGNNMVVLEAPALPLKFKVFFGKLQHLLFVGNFLLFAVRTEGVFRVSIPQLSKR